MQNIKDKTGGIGVKISSSGSFGTKKNSKETWQKLSKQNKMESDCKIVGGIPSNCQGPNY